MTVNYYKVLNVLPDANIAEIKSAYRKLARKLHPDVNGGTEEATQKFALIECCEFSLQPSPNFLFKVVSHAKI
nr:J domain-containing protein [Pyrinomonadaceae bacterium]